LNAKNSARAALVVIVGPTAVGKTGISLRLAEGLDGEIVSADSRQIYRGMDVGTDKVTARDRERVAHYLIDVTDPDETLTLAQFQRKAYAAIDRVIARGRLPILVGGSGQYVWAVVEGWGVPEVAPKHALRAELDTLSTDELARWLLILDPLAAQKIDHRNRRRVIRALEVTLTTGRPITALQRKAPPPYRILMVGLSLPRQELYYNIDARVDRMIESGLVDETRNLAARYGWSVPALSGLGYAQIGEHLRHGTSLQEAVAATKRETRRFVRQQANWFKPDDARIVWFDVSQKDTAAAAIEQYVRDWLHSEDARDRNLTAPFSL